MESGEESAILARIDLAIDRIEAALRSRSPSNASDSGHLAQRHAALRSVTEAAIRDIDALIAAEKG